jgi:5'(3')-deoxyribonucleotidase
MDGVLVDFRRGVCEIFRRDDPSTNWAFWESWDGITFANVNAKCNDYFWKYLDWTHEGREIEEAVRCEFDSNNIRLLTTPMDHPGSWTGKAMWVNRHLSLYNKRLIVTQVPKHEFAGPDTLLIDDKDQNIEEFRAAGGQGILVPRPWNKLHAWSDKTLEVVKNSLEAYQ